MDAQAFLKPGYRYAVVGATTNEQKYGYRVLQDLHSAGFTVVGFQPKYAGHCGMPWYPSLGALPCHPQVGCRSWSRLRSSPCRSSGSNQVPSRTQSPHGRSSSASS